MKSIERNPNEKDISLYEWLMLKYIQSLSRIVLFSKWAFKQISEHRFEQNAVPANHMLQKENLENKGKMFFLVLLKENLTAWC